MPKILDLGTIVFFLVLVIIGLFADRHALIGLERYSQAISSAALGLIVVASIVLGHPFTEQYAREGVPEEVWDTPGFRRTMVLMSGVWAAIFAVMAILGLIAEDRHRRSGIQRPAQLVHPDRAGDPRLSVQQVVPIPPPGIRGVTATAGEDTLLGAHLGENGREHAGWSGSSSTTTSPLHPTTSSPSW